MFFTIGDDGGRQVPSDAAISMWLYNVLPCWCLMLVLPEISNGKIKGWPILVEIKPLLKPHQKTSMSLTGWGYSPK